MSPDFAWRGRKVLVTGSDGFIGSHLVERLVEAGAQVRAFVYYNSQGSWGWLDTLDRRVLDATEVIAGDIRDAERVLQASEAIDTVFHLAALIAIPYSYVAASSYVSTNIQGTLNVLQAAQKHAVRHLVVTSTSEVYGTAQSVPITEKHPISAQSPYAATKIGADQLALSFHRSFDVPVSILRPFNTYGPRQSNRAVIPTIIAQALDGERRIRLGALEPTRDFTYVRDTAEGFLANAACPASVGETINLGVNEEISVGDLVRKIGRLMDRELEPVTDQQRLRPENSEVERLRSDNSRARALLGWEPRHDLDEGLRLTIDWFRENLHRYRPADYGI